MRIRGWMAECLERHGDCAGRDSGFMPDVVLEVARLGEEAAYDVSIHFPSGGEAPYLALSYCWGGDQPYKTTRARIISERLQLDWDSLPATIRDAVKVTVGLGFSYLWVDSLCIVQDGAEAQKAKQIAQMPQIYSNAVVTLAASKSTRASNGFLDEVEIGTMTRLAVKLRYVDRKNLVSGCIFVVEFTDESDVEPLDLRGWTFQERHLSTRIVDFEARCVSWSCLTEPPGRFRDGWGLFKPKSSSSKLRAWYALKRLRDADKHASMPSSHRAGPSCNTSIYTSSYYQTALEEFYSVVSDYTERVLSIPQDRILAVSGMAEMFGTILKDDYAVGLWKRSLPSGLLWNISCFSSDEPELQPRPPCFQAPSWSWAAVNGRVSAFHQTLSLATTVAEVDVRIELVEPTARYGAASWGRLTGRGPIRSALWLGSRSWRRADLYALHSSEATLWSGGRGLDKEGEPVCREIPLIRMIPDAIEDWDCGAREGQSGSLEETFVEVHLLQIGVFGWTEETLKRGHPIGLVLRETSRPAPTATGTVEVGITSSERSRCFTRLGLFTVDSWLWGEAVKAGDLKTADLPKLFFNSREPERFEIF